MHDINDLELRGIPSLFVASEEFRAAAAAQSTALGFAAPAYFLPHPIQDRTDAEMTALADEAYTALMALLVKADH